MQVDVYASVNDARPDGLLERTVIVIDVLRATSTIVTALAHGCRAIVPAETVRQAMRLQEPGDWLGGERFCQKISGFHLGNSPLEYRTPELAGKRVVLTTTNGTRAIRKAQTAYRVLAGSLLNASACAESALSAGRDIAIVCAGTHDVFSLEDGLCAGLLVRCLERLSGEPVGTNDFGRAMKLAFESAEHRLAETMLGCANGARLAKLGFREDVLFCAQTDRYGLVPALVDRTMVKF